MDKTTQYAMAVSDAILSLFRDEEDDGNYHFHFELEDVDATKFFTGMIIGCNLVFNKLTQEQKNNLEFTHICNQLVVQDMLSKNEEE